MTTIVSDSFNRANSTTGLGNADTGQTWVTLAGVMGINSNQAYVFSGAGQSYIESNYSDNIAVQITASVIGDFRPLYFRLTDVNNFLAVTAVNTTSGYKIQKVSGGSWTVLGTTTVFAQNNDTVRIELTGSTITLLINGVQQLQVVNTFNQTATKHGIGNWTTNSTRWDNFSVETLSSSGTTYIGSGTATGKSSLTSNETLILKSNNTSNGISSLTTSEQLISHQGTTYSGSGSSNGVSSLTTTESIISKSNGQSNGNASLNTTETKSYSANGNINSNSNVSQVGNVIYVDFATSQGQSNLTTTETFVQHGTTTYSANGSSNGQSTLANNDTLIFKSPSTVQGLSTLIDHVVEILSANGNVNGISSTTSTEQIIGHPTSSYSASGTTQGKSNVSSAEYVVFEVVDKSDGTSQVTSSEKVAYLPGGIANGLTSISTQEKYISTFEIIGTIELTSQLEINIYLVGVSELNISLKGVV